MDLICPVCGEPWALDCLHEEASVRYDEPYYLPAIGPATLTRERDKNPAYDEKAYQAVFATVSAEFRSKGCKALHEAFGPQNDCVPEERSEDGLTRSEAAGVLYELLGDDLDGAAAMLEDFGY